MPLVPTEEQTAAAPKQTIMERLGGPLAMSGLLASAVEIFYSKLLTDRRIAIFFENVDMPKLMKKQVEFLAYVFGGPEQYSGKDLWEAHAHLIKEKGLNETHFDLVAEHFQDTLEELNIEPEIIQECMDVLATARPVFENREAIDAKRAELIEKAVEGQKFDDALKQLEELKLEKDVEMSELRSQFKHLLAAKVPEAGGERAFIEKLRKQDPEEAAALEALLADPK
jgi:hemoglobin